MTDSWQIYVEKSSPDFAFNAEQGFQIAFFIFATSLRLGSE
jgi:hypothetical protein